ncbi:YdbL family protein [Thalassolituus sp. LLYu03]|uniref:YdbL family protein n=1 Tax=Thalassolituus sp. LLYu03 TaxID=3421656 RepID=UPI003D26A71F
MKKFLLTVSALLVSLSSWALELDSAKQMGLVGEQSNGYLGLVATGNNDAAALVVDINQQRKQKYQDIAAKQNTGLANIEKIAGEKLTQKAAASGEYYQDASGNWAR